MRAENGLIMRGVLFGEAGDGRYTASQLSFCTGEPLAFRHTTVRASHTPQGLTL
jgi:hypothetical protein